MNEQLQTPVSIIVFKRLDATKKMFETVRQAQPRELFIIADGWRNEAEKEKCLAVREYIEKTVDWDCLVHKNYSDTNLGCKMRVVSGLNWVFSEKEEAIILEDDCVPNQSFFRFCEEMLARFRDNPRIMQISGLNTQYPNKSFSTNGDSYYFSRFGEIWGWATWRRAWSLYDIDISLWPKARKEKMLLKRLEDPAVADFWEHRFDEIYSKRNEPRAFDAWAAQWVFAHLMNDGLSVVPKTNLIQNYGDDQDAARPKDIEADEMRYRRPVTPLLFPLTHPKNIEINSQADHFTIYDGFRVKRKLSEKILFFLKTKTPFLHSMVKKLKIN